MPLAFLVAPVIADPSVTVPQLLHQQVYDVLGYISPTWKLDPGVAAYIRSAVALAAIPAAIVLARFLPKSRWQGAPLVVWTVTMLFALRVAEPELFPYFLAPALALAPMSAARLPWWRLASVCALAVWLNYWLHVAVQAKWSLWLILVSQLCLIGWLAFPRRGEHVVNGRTCPSTKHLRHSGLGSERSGSGRALDQRPKKSPVGRHVRPLGRIADLRPVNSAGTLVWARSRRRRPRFLPPGLIEQPTRGYFCLMRWLKAD